MTMTRLLLVVWTLVGGIDVVTAQPAPDPLTPVGKYLCSGYKDDGSTWSMSLEVVPFGDAYELHWGDIRPTPLIGLAVQLGEWLAVSIVDRSGTARDPQTGQPVVAFGVEMYQIKPGGLLGHWTGGDGIVRQEVCTAAGLAA